MSRDENTSKVVCPACGSQNEHGQKVCYLCNWDIPQEISLGTTKDIGKEYAEEIEKKRQNNFRAMLAVAYQTGKKDESLFAQLNNPLLQVIGVNDWGKKIEKEFANDHNEFMLKNLHSTLNNLEATIYKIAMGEIQGALIIEAALSHLFLGYLRADNHGTLEWSDLQEIEWGKIIPNIASDSLGKEIMLAGTLAVDQYKNLLSKRIMKWLDKHQERSNTKVFVCTGVYGWKHQNALHEIFEEEQIKYETQIYDIRKTSSARDTAEQFMANAPLRYAFFLLGVKLEKNQDQAKVLPKEIEIIPAGKPIDEIKPKRLFVESANYADNKVLLPILLKMQSKTPTLASCLEMEIAPEDRGTITFMLSAHDHLLHVQGAETRELSGLKLEQIVKDIPESVSLLPQALDLVIILDTVADETTLKSRCEFAKKIVEECLLELGDQTGKLLQISVVAYGDREVVTGRENPDWPDVVRTLSWTNNEQSIQSFLDNLTSTPVEKCDFEAGLEEALGDILNFDWRPGTRHIILAIGDRPPHPLKPDPKYLTQLGSTMHKDWQYLLNELKNRIRTKNILVRCDLIWPTNTPPKYAKEYGNKFWSQFTQEKPFEFNNWIDSAEITTKILQQPASQTKTLRLPVFVDMSRQ